MGFWVGSWGVVGGGLGRKGWVSCACSGEGRWGGLVRWGCVLDVHRGGGCE